MNVLEIIVLIVFVTLSILLTLVTLSALQLIKELKTSLSKINKLLDNPQSLPKVPFKKLDESFNFPQPVKSSSAPRLFHRQKQS